MRHGQKSVSKSGTMPHEMCIVVQKPSGKWSVAGMVKVPVDGHGRTGLPAVRSVVQLVPEAGFEQQQSVPTPARKRWTRLLLDTVAESVILRLAVRALSSC